MPRHGLLREKAVHAVANAAVAGLAFLLVRALGLFGLALRAGVATAAALVFKVVGAVEAHGGLAFLGEKAALGGLELLRGHFCGCGVLGNMYRCLSSNARTDAIRDAIGNMAKLNEKKYKQDLRRTFLVARQGCISPTSSPRGTTCRRHLSPRGTACRRGALPVAEGHCLSPSLLTYRRDVSPTEMLPFREKTVGSAFWNQTHEFHLRSQNDRILPQVLVVPAPEASNEVSVAHHGQESPLGDDAGFVPTQNSHPQRDVRQDCKVDGRVWKRSGRNQHARGPANVPGSTGSMISWEKKEKTTLPLRQTMAVEDGQKESTRSLGVLRGQTKSLGRLFRKLRRGRC